MTPAWSLGALFVAMASSRAAAGALTITGVVEMGGGRTTSGGGGDRGVCAPLPLTHAVHSVQRRQQHGKRCDGRQRQQDVQMGMTEMVELL